jgi:hypothetical protein
MCRTKKVHDRFGAMIRLIFELSALGRRNVFGAATRGQQRTAFALMSKD